MNLWRNVVNRFLIKFWIKCKFGNILEIQFMKICAFDSVEDEMLILLLLILTSTLEPAVAQNNNAKTLKQLKRLVIYRNFQHSEYRPTLLSRLQGWRLWSSKLRIWSTPSKGRPPRTPPLQPTMWSWSLTTTSPQGPASATSRPSRAGRRMWTSTGTPQPPPAPPTPSPAPLGSLSPL